MMIFSGRDFVYFKKYCQLNNKKEVDDFVGFMKCILRFGVMFANQLKTRSTRKKRRRAEQR